MLVSLTQVQHGGGTMVATTAEHGLTVDADGHILEPANLWQEYLIPRFRAVSYTHLTLPTILLV